MSEMPTSCEHCDFVKLDTEVYGAPYVYSCYAVTFTNRLSKANMQKKRPQWCPLQEGKE